MKYNLADIYQDRIEEIDKQIGMYVHQKKWDKVKQLREEKKGLIQKVQKMQEKGA